MTVEQRLKLMIGELNFVVAALQTQLEAANKKIEELTPKTVEKQPEPAAA